MENMQKIALRMELEGMIKELEIKEAIGFRGYTVLKVENGYKVQWLYGIPKTFTTVKEAVTEILL